MPSQSTGAASGMLTTTQQFAMVLGIAGVGTLFFAREATSGIVSALQFGLFADIALVAFALGMTFLLPRAKPAGAPPPSRTWTTTASTSICSKALCDLKRIFGDRAALLVSQSNYNGAMSASRPTAVVDPRRRLAARSPARNWPRASGWP